MKNKDIKRKWDQHRKSGTGHDEHLNWSIEFEHDIIVLLLKRSFGFLKFKFKVYLDFEHINHVFCMELILILGNQEVEHKKLLHQYPQFSRLSKHLVTFPL